MKKATNHGEGEVLEIGQLLMERHVGRLIRDARDGPDHKVPPARIVYERSASTSVGPLGSKGLDGTRGGLCDYPLPCAVCMCGNRGSFANGMLLSRLVTCVSNSGLSPVTCRYMDEGLERAGCMAGEKTSNVTGTMGGGWRLEAHAGGQSGADMGLGR
jgi:hypothetical protein